MRTLDQQIIERYTGQPVALPPAAREQVEQQIGPILLYGFADLDPASRATNSWLVLGHTRGAVAVETAGGSWDITVFDRSRVRQVVVLPGLSADSMTITAGAGEPPLALLRYSHRQRRAFENIRFVLDEQLAGTTVPVATDADAEYASAVARPMRDAQSAIGGKPARAIGRLLRYLRPYRRQVLVGLLSATFITLLSLVPPYIAGTLIDRVVRRTGATGDALKQTQVVAWLAIAALALVHLARQAAAIVRLRVSAVLGEWVARDLRSELYAHLQRLSLSFYSRKKTGGLITRVSADTDRLWDFVAFGMVDVSLAVVTLLALSGVLLSLDWRLGLVMTLPVPLFCYAIYRHGEGMNNLFVRVWRKWSRMTDLLSDTIPGARVVKAFNQEEREIGRFDTRNRDVTGEVTRLHHSWTTFWPTLMLLVQGTTVAVWVCALPRLFGHGAELSAGTFVSFLLYTAMFTGPIEVIGQMTRTINRATSSAHRVFEVLDTEPEVRDVPQPVRLEPVQGRVAFENVTFGYDGVRQVLRGVSFDVQPGEMIGLVGPSGGGKSTIANLIARFYDVTSGAVLVDGVDVRQLDTGHYRRQIGIVLQDPYLFSGTILDNIRYGSPDASLAEVIAASRAANAHGFIGKLTEGYDTVVGERGHTLSGGERQRVSIARAILQDPRLLILDEATSAVDTETEHEIQEALDRLVRGRTVFAIAHRLSTLRKASRLFVIEDGRLVESGTHQELVNTAKGRYRRLYEMQITLG